MIHSRRLLRSTLLGVVGAAVLLPTQTANAAELVPITASARCSTISPFTMKISAKVPAETAPGESVALTDVKMAVDFDYPYTQLPTPGFDPETAHVALDEVTISVVGGSPATVALNGLPNAFAPATISGGSQRRFTTNTIAAGDSAPTTTSGSDPVVFRLEKVDFRFGYDLGSGAPVNRATCTPPVDQAGLAVVPSAGGLPAAPQIGSLSPSVASAAGGEKVTIKGKGFSAATALLFDGGVRYQGQDLTVVDDETIEFTAPFTDPYWGGDTVELQVRSSFGTSAKTLFSWGGPRLPVPTIASVSPNRVPITASTAPLYFDVTGTGLNRLSVDDSVNLGYGDNADGDVYNGVALVVSVAPDGTSMRLRVNRYGYAFQAGTSDLQFTARGACETASCRTADTPGDDVTFYDPSQVPVDAPPAGGYLVQGSSALKTLVKGSVPLSGALTGVAYAQGTGAFAGDLALAPATANLTALGLLPVKAQLAFVPTERASGTLDASGLSVNAKLRIKLPKVSVFGIELAGGANCQAKQITSVPLKSTGAFSAATGGALAGTFSISDLSGCGVLTGIVSSLTAGSGNAIALLLSPKS